jgi:hypothetical protein
MWFCIKEKVFESKLSMNDVSKLASFQNTWL